MPEVACASGVGAGSGATAPPDPRSWWRSGEDRLSWCSTTSPRSPCRSWRARGAGARNWATRRTSSARSCGRWRPRSPPAASRSWPMPVASTRRPAGDALQKVLDELGVRLAVAVVLGDDSARSCGTLRAAGRHGYGERRHRCPPRSPVQMPTLAPFRSRRRWPRVPTSSSPVAAPTARMALAPLIHAFGWQPERLRPARHGQSCRAHHRMRPAGHRRASSPTGARALPTGTTSATRSSNAPPTAASS